MRYTLQYDPSLRVIVAKTIGELDAFGVEQMSAQLASIIDETGCTLVLNDLRDASISSSAFEIYAMPRIVRDAGVPSKCKRALLVQSLPSAFSFLETTSVNMGQRVKLFTDFDIAITWLHGAGGHL